jgi:hypothetical protein
MMRNLYEYDLPLRVVKRDMGEGWGFRYFIIDAYEKDICIVDDENLAEDIKIALEERIEKLRRYESEEATE